MDGQRIDLARAVEVPARAAVERLLEWSAPVRSELGIEVALPERNGAQRQRALLEEGATLREAFAATVAHTRETYAHPGQEEVHAR